MKISDFHLPSSTFNYILFLQLDYCLIMEELMLEFEFEFDYGSFFKKLSVINGGEQ